MGYDEWWRQVHTVRVTMEELMREFNNARSKYEAAMMMRKKSKMLRDGRESLERSYVMAKGLLDVCNVLITIGETFTPEERKENYEHLMMRLREARDYAEEVINYVEKTTNEPQQ